MQITYTRSEAAKLLHVSLPTFDRLLQRTIHPIPQITAGRRILIPAAELQRWLHDEAERHEQVV